jgi:hypothetical protein
VNRRAIIEEAPLADAAIGALRGGEVILAARERAARLLDRLLGERAGGSGAVDGWDQVARRGRIEHLLASEHLHDEDEFLRRHLDGEQLYLAREARRPGVSAGVLCWDLTVAVLGTPRLAALGTALAVKGRLAEEGAWFRLMVNAAVASELSTREDLEALLAVPPLAAPAGEGAWRAALNRTTRLAEPPALYWLATEPDLPPSEEVARLNAGGASPAVLLAADARRLRLFLGRTAGPSRWEEAGAAALPGDRLWR